MLAYFEIFITFEFRDQLREVCNCVGRMPAHFVRLSDAEKAKIGTVEPTKETTNPYPVQLGSI
jgi:hypothetical protein